MTKHDLIRLETALATLSDADLETLMDRLQAAMQKVAYEKILRENAAFQAAYAATYRDDMRV